MRSLILSLLFMAISIVSYSQAVEICGDSQMPANVSNLTVPPAANTTLMIDAAWTANVDGYTPSTLAGGFTSAYWSFTVASSGYYSISIEGVAGSPTEGNPISVSLGTDCIDLATDSEIFADDVPLNGMAKTATCTNLIGGTTYTMALAVDPANAGDVIVNVTSTIVASNDDCLTTVPALAIGANTGDNSCSDGLVWYAYTVANGGSVEVAVSPSGSATEISTPVITSTHLDDCGNADEGVTMWTCLPVGTIIYFEAGDDTAPVEQGDFTITITDDATTVANDACADVTVTPAPTCETTTLTTPGVDDNTTGACPDQFAGCPTFETQNTVWFAFSTSTDAQTVDIEVTNGSISDAEFALIDASAGCPTMGSPATAIGGCQTGGQLLGQAISGNTTYYVAVSTASGGTDGTFTLTVTPQNPPSNDVCATGAIDISATAAAGVDGTTACATQGAFDFCPTLSEDHVVYYTYTVDASITTNRTLTITTSGSTAPITGDATSLGLGVFADCLGTPVTMPSGANLIPLAGSDLCSPLTGAITYECVEPGTSFTIAVASEDMMEGDFNIMITEMATGTADNDACDLGTNPDITMVTSGTNFCADGELNFCGMATTADHQVWYQYTNTTGNNVDLEVTFSGTGTMTSATDLSMVVLSGACGTMEAFPGTPTAGYCSILGTPTTIGCIESGETIRILVGSEEDPSTPGPEGDFTISTDVITNAPANDECTGAIDVTPPMTCAWTLLSTISPGPTAENACPEDFATFPAGCDFTTESTVWYSFTVPNNGSTFTFDIRNISDDEFVTIFEDTSADCDGYGTPAISADCETGAGPHGANYDDLTPGATYFIAVGDPDPVGGFDLEIRLNELPMNDECDNAVMLTAGAATMGTTTCATQPTAGEYDSTECTDDDETNSVFYTYTVPAGDKGFHVTITGTGTPAITGDINLVVFNTESGACDTGAGSASVEDEVCTASGTLNEEFECIGEGTYVIRVASSDSNAGDFDIEITALTAVDHDTCDDPDLSLNPGTECMWMASQANSEDACPEDPNIDPDGPGTVGCGIDEFPVVWYSITAPADADFLDLRITGAGAGTPFMSVYDNGTVCSALTLVPTSENCYSGIFDDLDALGQDQIPVTGGNTYLIAIGVDDAEGSTVDFEIKWITPPDNDECVDAEVLTAGAATPGTNLCATQPMTGEYNSTVCADADAQQNTVFYTYTVPDGDKGFHVTITGTGATAPLMGDINVVVFNTDSGACDTGTGSGSVEDEVCTASATLNEEFECVGEGTYVIRVSTSDDNSGEFDITIEAQTLEQPNDNCDDADTAAFADPDDCVWIETDAMTNGACPESFSVAGCADDMENFPVTWYEVTAPANAEFLDLRINFGGTNPFLAVFEAGTDCDNLTAVAGTQCYQGIFTDLVAAGNALIDVTPGATYLIAVGNQAMAGSLIQFGIKWITPPDNDDCADAEDFNALTAGADPGTFTQTFTEETTQCATEAITGSACDDDKINTVWYSYTVEADVKEITIDVTNYTNSDPAGTAQFSVAAVESCPIPGGTVTLFNQVDGTPADYCGGEGEDLLTLSCIAEGTEIFFLVSSSVENEGTFDVTINTAEPVCTYTNDECADASDLTGNPSPLILDDPAGCVVVSGCNDLACSEAPFNTACGGDMLNTVFYTFMTDALLGPDGTQVDAAFVNLEITNGEAGELDAPGAVLFEGDCVAALVGGCAGTSDGPGSFNSGPLGDPIAIQPNTIYTIMVYNTDPDQNGGEFDLCVTVVSGCVNDLCADAATLEPNVLTDNPASTVGCTPDDALVQGCSSEYQEATLWYQIEVPEGFNQFEVTVTNNSAADGGVGMGTGNISLAVGPLDCNALDADETLLAECDAFGTHVVDCAVEFGVYYIQIGSADEMDAGDFTIEWTPIVDTEPINDLCSDAEEITPGANCEWMAFSGDLKGACPEINDAGACMFSENPAVWFKITVTDPDVLDMDLNITGLNNPIIGIFEFDCSQVSEPSMGIVSTPSNADGPVDCIEMEMVEGVAVTTGTEYFILVSSSTGEELLFDGEIRLNAPPENDDPCLNSDNPPYDLTGGGSHPGTTCCARGPKDVDPDGSPADFANVECGVATEDAAVWYIYTVDEADEGYQVILEGDGFGGNSAIEVYWGAPDVGCTGGNVEVIGTECADNNAEFKVPNCPPNPGDVILVKVSTDDADDICGDFILTIIPASCDVPSADECVDAVDVIGPIDADLNCVDFTETPFEGCLDYACPETLVGDCDLGMNPTVWIQVEAGEFSQQLITNIVPNDDWEPVWAIYTGDCDDLTIVAGGTSGALTNCSNDDDSPAHQVPVDEDETYYIAISAQGLDPGEDGGFTGTALTTAGCVSCIGGNDDFSLACNNTAEWEITDRSSDRDLDDEEFCVGEEVTMCTEFTYDASATSIDWLHGIMPNFGPGWDINSFNGSGATLTVSTGTAGEWFEADGDCAPYITETMPLLCTYTDSEGVLRICNDFCGTCPCSGPLQEDSPLPSGWFWNQGGGQPDCAGECTPSDNYGIGANIVSVEICFTISVRAFESQGECESTNADGLPNNDLQIYLVSTSDGVSGCYDDPTAECTLDAPQFSPPWKVDCNTPPRVLGDDDEICDNGTTDIFVQTQDGTATEVVVEPITNGSVSGANPYNFTSGSGTIADMLDNLTTTEQTQQYIVYAVDPSKPCPGVRDTIDVIIYPELIVELLDDYVCEGACITISPDISGGSGVGTEYEWSTGETTASITVCPVVPTTYSVTVTDQIGGEDGCEGIDDAEIDVADPVLLSWITPDPWDICQDGEFDILFPDFVAELSFDQGQAPFSVNWMPDPGLEGSPGLPEGRWIINEEETTGSAGPLQLCAEVTDFLGCQETICMTVNISGEVSVIADLLPITCGGTSAAVIVTAFDLATFDDAESFNLFGGCPAEALLESDILASNATATINIDESYLLNYDSFIIEAITPGGCVGRICVEIEIPQGIPVEITGDENICEGEEATISVVNVGDYGAGATYVWTPDVGDTPTVTFNPTISQQYFVEVTGDDGCVSDTSWTVNVNPDPIIGLSGTTTFCSGGTATVTATGGGTYSWAGTNGTATDNTFEANAAGMVTLTVTSDFGCTSDTTITFTQENVITVNIGGPDLCDGVTDTLFVTGSFTDYEWTFNSAVVGTDSILEVTEAGTYSIAVTDITGCPGVGEITIANQATPIAMVTDSVTVCNEDSGVGPVTVDFDAQITGAAGEWRQLDAVSGLTFDPANPGTVDFTAIAPGCYAFAYETQNAMAPCLNTSDTLFVCVESCPCPKPTISGVPDMCNDEQYDLSASVVTPDAGTWSVVSGPDPDLGSIITGTVFNANGIDPGIYTVQFTLDAPGNSPPCDVSETEMFEVFPVLEISTNDGVMCNIAGQPDPIVLDLFTLISVDATDGGTWTQTDGDAVTITGSTIMSSDLSIFPTTLTFEYTSGDPVGPCGPTTVSVEVLIRDCNCKIVAVGDTTLCNDGTAIDLTSLLTNPDNLSGDWTTTGNLVGASMFDPAGLPSGAYEIAYTLTESAGPGCDTEYLGMVLVNRAPEITLATGDQPCSMDTGNGPTAIDLYSWIVAANTSAGTWTQTSGPTVTINDDGTSAVIDFDPFDENEQFTFVYTTTTANEPCIDISEEITITVQDCNCPDLMMGELDPICNNAGPVDITDLAAGSAPGVYTFFNAAGDDLTALISGGNMIDVTGLDAGTYSVIYTLEPAPSGNCTAAMTRELAVENYATIAGDTEAEVCSDPDGNDPTFLNFFNLVPNSVAAGWTDVDNSNVDLSTDAAITMVSFVDVPAGNYTFTYTVDNTDPCEDYVHTLVVAVTDDCNCPSINPLNIPDVCNTDGAVDLTAYDDTNNPGTWSSTEVTINGGNSLDPTGLAAGMYTLTYTITNPLEDCPETEEVMVMIGEPANPGVAEEPAETCESDSQVFVLADLLEGEDATGTWAETSGTASTGFDGTSFDTDGQTAGTYTFLYTIGNNDPCPDVSETVTVIITPDPIADAGGEKFIDCTNSVAQIGGDNTSTGADFTYSWTNAAGDEVGTTATLDVQNGGEYTLTVINGVTGCQAVSTTTVMQSDDLVTMEVVASNITCNGDDDGGIFITNQMGGDGDYTYTLGNNPSTTDPASFNSLGAGEYTITIADGAGCSTPYMFTITEPDAVSVSIAGEDILVGDFGDEFELTIEPVGATVDSISWSDFNTPDIIYCSGTPEECTSITVAPTETTTNVYVEVFDANGCTANDQVQLQLEQITDVTFPNIITPNGDNSNDFFFIASDDVERVLRMQIFDRWGELIWERKDFEPRMPDLGWNGKFNGSTVVPGVYVFTVEVQYVEGAQQPTEIFTGDVTVTDSE